jgi:hypothetical protein
MAASMYIVVEGEDPGYDIFVNGRSLARHEDALEKLALQLGVRPLIEFFSADENSMSLLIEEGAGNPEIMRRLPPPQWYTAADGLATVRALLDALWRSRSCWEVTASGCFRSCVSMRWCWRRHRLGRCVGIWRLAGAKGRLMVVGCWLLVEWLSPLFCVNYSIDVT